MITDMDMRMLLRLCVREANGCLVWLGGTNGRDRKGRVALYNGGSSSPDRVVWEYYSKRRLPPNQRIRQTCGNRLCCELSHLHSEKRRSPIPDSPIEQHPRNELLRTYLTQKLEQTKIAGGRGAESPFTTFSISKAQAAILNRYPRQLPTLLWSALTEFDPKTVTPDEMRLARHDDFVKCCAVSNVNLKRSVRELAEHLGVPASIVYRILLRRALGHAGVPTVAAK